MKIKSKAILFVILSQLLCLVSNAQEMRIIKGKPGEIFMLPEVGAIIQLEDKKILVENVMPKDMRDKNYKNVDLQEKDEILMVNGKKIKTPKDCEDIYDKLKVGEEFKMGIGRNDKMFIVSFKKADPEKLKSGGGMVVKMNDKDEDIRVLPEFGIVLSGSKGKVTIKEVIKEIPKGTIKCNATEELSTTCFVRIKSPIILTPPKTVAIIKLIYLKNISRPRLINNPIRK